jgi:protein involved in sex pheromone biosynthesis
VHCDSVYILDIDDSSHLREGAAMAAYVISPCRVRGLIWLRDVPVSVESYGRWSHPAIKLLHTLGEMAAGPGGVSRASFVAGALQELSIGLVRV